MHVVDKRGGPMAEINITPLVDVVLVLLIIFMVITFLLGSGIDVPLPDTTAAQEVRDGGQHLVVSLKKSNARVILAPGSTGPAPRIPPEVYVDTTRTSMDTLIEDMNKAYREKPERSVLIKGDKQLTWRDVREVMDVIHDGGVNQMYLATEQERGE
jgi:biopolymer transport protein TolR